MTEKKKLPEQKAFHVYQKAEPVDPRSDLKLSPKESDEAFKKYNKDQNKESEKSKRSGEPGTGRRAVFVPQADPSHSWNTFAERQQQRRQDRQNQARRKPYVQVASRTLAQTGSPARIGRVQPLRRPLPYRASSAIPRRSGKLKARRSIFWRLIAGLALGILVVIGISYLLTGNTFRVQRIKVEGTRDNNLISAIQRLDVQGENLFTLDTASMAEHIKALPQVDSVEVSKQWPDQITVHLVERKALLFWQTGQGTYTIDKQGVVIAKTSDSGQSSPLLTVVDITAQNNQGQEQGQGNAHLQREIRPGAHLDSATIAFAIDVSKRLPQMIGETSYKLYYDGTMYTGTTDQVKGRPGSRGSYIVESSNGWKAYFGGPDDTNPLDNKLMALREILALAQKQKLNVTTIDLRYGLRPVFTLQQ